MSLEQFHYTLPDGHEIKLPKFENVKAGLIRKTRRLDAADQMFTILEDLMTDEDLEHLDDLTREELNSFSKAWQEASSIKPGESSGS